MTALGLALDRNQGAKSGKSEKSYAEELRGLFKNVRRTVGNDDQCVDARMGDKKTCRFLRTGPGHEGKL